MSPIDEHLDETVGVRLRRLRLERGFGSFTRPDRIIALQFGAREPVERDSAQQRTIYEGVLRRMSAAERERAPGPAPHYVPSLARERALWDEGYDVVVGKVPMGAVGAPTVYGDRGGMIKIVGDSKYGELLGASIVSGSAGADSGARVSATRSATSTGR